jgi:acetyl esterase/lipase
MKYTFSKLVIFTPVLLLLLVFSCQETSEPDILPAQELLENSYGSDGKQKMDIYLPAGRSKANTPLLVYIHGGGWIDGDKNEFLKFKPTLENLFPEYAFITLNYRLFDFATGKNKFPAQESDIISAFTYIMTNLEKWNISNTIVLAGASAGGHLALLHAYKNNKNGNLKAVIAFFPPANLIELYKFNNLTALGLESVLGGKPDQISQSYIASSPVYFLGPSSPPTIFFHGELDPVVPISQSLFLEIGLQNSGVPYRFIRVPNQGHGFTDPTYTELLKEARNFIQGL